MVPSCRMACSPARRCRPIPTITAARALVDANGGNPCGYPPPCAFTM
nr:hypothetical protein RVX_0520 [Nitratidesulfovibrio sp. HK-II]